MASYSSLNREVKLFVKLDWNIEITARSFLDSWIVLVWSIQEMQRHDNQFAWTWPNIFLKSILEVFNIMYIQHCLSNAMDIGTNTLKVIK